MTERDSKLDSQALSQHNPANQEPPSDQRTQENELAASLLTKFGHWQYVAESKEIILSDQALQFCHAFKPQMKLADFLDSFYPGDRELARQLLFRAVERRLPFQIEIRLFSNEDSVLWINFRADVVEGENSYLNVSGFMEDVTPRKLIEREQYRRNQVLEALSSGASTSYIFSILIRIVEDGHIHTTSAFWSIDDQFDGIQPVVGGIGLKIEYLDWAEEAGHPLENLGAKQDEFLLSSLEDLPFDDKQKDELRFKGIYGLAILPIHSPDIKFKGFLLTYILKDNFLKLIDQDLHQTVGSLAKMVIRQKEAETEIQYRRDFELLISKISSRFVRVTPQETDSAINEALAKVGKFAGADRSYIFLLSGNGRFFSNSHEWCNEGIEPQKEVLQQLKLEEFPFSKERLQAPYLINDVSSLPEEASNDRELLEMQQIKSLIILPMFVGNEWIGFLGFDAVFKKRSWSVEDQSLLQFIGEIIASALKRKESYERIQNTNLILEKKVEERTAELLHSNQSLERFAFMASHDMKEPLRMVISYLQLLKIRNKGVLSDNDIEYLDYALDGGRRMSKLLEAILAYSRVNMTDRPMLPVKLDRVMEHVLDNLKILINEKDAQIKLSKLPVIDADMQQMEQLFQNLLSNGLKFQSGNRRPVIKIKAEDKGEYVEFSVSDNGIGIPDQYKQYIFEVFKRLHARDEYKGSGVGLSICKEIVRRHGGEIWLESSPGKGSTFYFSLKKKHENLQNA